MTGPLYRLGGLCSRRHWLVIAVWLLVAAGLVAGASAAGEQNSDNLSLPGTDSKRATDLLQANLPDEAYGTNPVVLRATSGTLADEKNKNAVNKTAVSLRKADEVIRVVSPFDKQGAAALSKDKRIGYLSVTLAVGASDLTKEEAESIIDATEPA